MDKFTWLLLAGFTLFLGSSQNDKKSENIDISTTNNNQVNNMKLGAFSVSLNVKDINLSKEFYENLGFIVFAGDISKNYFIMKNENSLIGLFQEMFEGYYQYDNDNFYYYFLFDSFTSFELCFLGNSANINLNFI